MVHPQTLALLKSLGYDTRSLRSKSCNEFAKPGAAPIDFFFTVCDNAAGETCPIWPGKPMTAHWGIEDPAAVEGTDIQKEAAFVQAFRYLQRRIDLFISLPLRSIDRLSLGTKLRDIGNIEGATSSNDKAS
jgi:arsenate reductase